MRSMRPAVARSCHWAGAPRTSQARGAASPCACLCSSTRLTSPQMLLQAAHWRVCSVASWTPRQRPRHPHAPPWCAPRTWMCTGEHAPSERCVTATRLLLCGTAHTQGVHASVTHARRSGVSAAACASLRGAPQRTMPHAACARARGTAARQCPSESCLRMQRAIARTRWCSAAFRMFTRTPRPWQLQRRRCAVRLCAAATSWWRTRQSAHSGPSRAPSAARSARSADWWRTPPPAPL